MGDSTSRSMTPLRLFDLGARLMFLFCRRNHMAVPRLVLYGSPWRISACAYYRPTTIHVNIAHTARLGYGGRAWSWPGYVVDRTPYGVIQHELGHHVDWLLSGRSKRRWSGDLSAKIRQESKSKPISGYCPNDEEWFAEMFRLFVTNPDLLKSIRPSVYVALRDQGLKPYFRATWKSLLEGAPKRTIAQAAKKIKEVK